MSPWIKNIINFCYSKVEYADIDLLEVKAHDVRVLAASKGLYQQTKSCKPAMRSHTVHSFLSVSGTCQYKTRKLVPFT